MVFSGRLPCKDKVVVDALRTLIETFWHDNTRVSPNQRDVVRRQIGSINHEPHVKHYLDMTQTKFYERFLQKFSQIRISQIFFEMVNPFYIKINHVCTTCCCRMHIEFSLHYDIFHHICSTLHTNNVLKECNIQAPPKSIREFISSVLCNRHDGYIYYKIHCLEGSCAICGGLQCLPRCVHLESTHEIGTKLVSFKKYKRVTYGVKYGKDLKRCKLVKNDICVVEFMKMFQEKIVYEYIMHTHRARWLDEKFKLCKDTFTLGTIVCIIDFAKNYIVQPQN